MNLRNKLRRFRALPIHDKGVFVEATVLLALARLLILVAPMHQIARWLALAPDKCSCDKILLLRVRRAVVTTARNVPWNAVCLPQAMVAKAMLARRGYGSTLHLGARFDASGKLIGHAWLVAGNTVVVGGAAAAQIQPLARFG